MNQDEQIEIERRQHVAAVVAECQTAVPPVPLNHGIVRAILAQRLPGFDYLDDADDFHRHLDSGMDIAPARDTNVSGDLHEQPQAEQPAEPVPEPINVPELRERHRQLDQHAATLRSAIYQLTAARQIARADLAAAISGWSASVPVLTAEQNVRAYLAASQAERQHAKDVGKTAPPAAYGRSVVDRQAAWSKGGDASDYARKGMRYGFRKPPRPLANLTDPLGAKPVAK